MTPTLPQQPDEVRTRVIVIVGVASVIATALLVAVAWWFVVPPGPSISPAHPNVLEHGLYEVASQHVAPQLGRMEWIDRKRRVVRIPIDIAIDAVIADPTLIGPPRVREAKR